MKIIFGERQNRGETKREESPEKYSTEIEQIRKESIVGGDGGGRRKGEEEQVCLKPSHSEAVCALGWLAD